LNRNTKHAVQTKLSKLADLLIDNGTQEQLDIVEDILAFDLAYDESAEEIEKLKRENAELKSKLEWYDRVYGNIIMINNR
jgi:hypothetical protein